MRDNGQSGPDEYYMSLALEQAKQAGLRGEIPVGAVIVKDGRVIAEAGNEREALRDPTAHAEMLALRRASAAMGDWRMNGCTLYVTLEPCPMCAGALAMSRVSGIVFGAWDERMGCCGSRYLIPCDEMMGKKPPDIRSDVQADECRRLLLQPLEEKRRAE